MRGILIAALLAGTVGITGSSPTLAATVNGTVIGNAAGTAQLVEQARWRRCHWHHRWHSRHWRHCRWRW